MATSKNILRVSFRYAGGNHSPATYTLGHAVYRETCNGTGWRFFPQVAGREPSRKFHETWEACLPRWVRFPDGCESKFVDSVLDPVE